MAMALSMPLARSVACFSMNVRVLQTRRPSAAARLRRLLIPASLFCISTARPIYKTVHYLEKLLSAVSETNRSSANEITRFKVGSRMSQAVSYNGCVHVAGQIADDRKTSIEEQTRQVLAKVDALIAEAGASRADLVAVN